MPLPMSLARFNRQVTNRITGLFATRVPTFGVIVHRGRKSGRLYRTPVNVFSWPDGYVVALPYGPDADWVKNVIAAGNCELETRGRSERLYSPRVLHDETQEQVMPRLVGPVFRPIVRRMMRRLRVFDFLSLERIL